MINNLEIIKPYQHLIINTNADYHLQFDVTKDVSLFIDIQNVQTLTIEANVLENNKLTLFIWNDAKQKIKTIENYRVLNNGKLNLAYGECNDYDINRNSTIDLEEEYAEAIVKLAALCKTNKHYKIAVNQFAPYTKGLMENYGVVLTAGNYFMDCIGSIKKGAHDSASHQISRALTYSEEVQATILPELLIDENEVEASHATTVGQIDEEQMIYLKSRGLSEMQIISLITVGYLLPIADFIEDKQLKQEIQTKIESKVVESCGQ